MIEQWTEFLNEYLPEPWMRALAVLVTGILVGWIAQFVLTRGIARLARRSLTELDDRVIAILARPIFLTPILVGVYYGFRTLQVSPEPQLLVLRLTQTMGVLLWTGAAFRMSRPLLDSFSRLADRVRWIERRTVPLIDNFGRLLLFILAVLAKGPALHRL